MPANDQINIRGEYALSQAFASLFAGILFLTIENEEIPLGQIKY